jgi:hypothetical protein
MIRGKGSQFGEQKTAYQATIDLIELYGPESKQNLTATIQGFRDRIVRNRKRMLKLWNQMSECDTPSPMVDQLDEYEKLNNDCRQCGIYIAELSYLKYQL